MTGTSAADPAALGILGGSFDPVHHGHLRLAEEAIERLGLNRVLMVPARPWQRDTAASASDRLRMVELACAGNPRLVAEPMEVQREGPSYTVDTLRTLRARHGDQCALWLVVGADAFLRLPSWRSWRSLPSLCHLAIVPRPRVDIAAGLPAELAGWWAQRDRPVVPGGTGGLAVLDAPELEISATAIRAKLAAGHSPRYLLPDCVLDYIENAGLYTLEGHGA